MKITLQSLILASIFLSNALFACDIVEKRRVHRGMNKGIAGVCSNDGSDIECYYAGQYSGGLTCSGPQGTNSGYNLQNLIYSVCGCGREDRDDNLQEQINQEFK